MLHAGRGPGRNGLCCSFAADRCGHCCSGLRSSRYRSGPNEAAAINLEIIELRLRHGQITVMPELWPMLSQPGQVLNLIDALTHPQGLCATMSNVSEVAPAFLAKLQAEAWSRPALAARVEALAGSLRRRFNLRAAKLGYEAVPPILSTVFKTSCGLLGFFSMFTTFGTPQDITLAALRVEHMFAADARARAVLVANVA